MIKFIIFQTNFREAMLAEMGVAIGVDGHTVGLFQPRRVMCVVMCCVLDDGLLVHHFAREES